MTTSREPAYPADVTYKQAAAVQPFANTLVNMDMTGAQIKAVLEQQWQRDNLGNVPSRPFLRLGTSKGFTYNYTEATDPAHSPAKLGTVTSMWLNGTKITNAGVYSVTMNSFLASGGDNFRAFLDGADKRDTGVSDLKAQVDYFAANAQPTPLAADFAQHAVRVTFPGGAPASYGTGDTVAFNLASLSMTGPGDTQDATIKVTLNGADVQTGIPVTTTLTSNPDDEPGTASVSFNLPPGVPGGEQKLHIIGAATGTDVIVPIQVTMVEPATRDIQIIGTNDFHGRIAKDPTSAAAGAGVMAGAVKQLRTANPDTVFAAAGDLIGASTFESFIQNDKPTIDALNAAGLDVSSVGQPRVRPGLQRPGQPRHGAVQRVDQPQGWCRLAVPGRERPVQGQRQPGPAGDLDQGLRFGPRRLRRHRHRAPARAGQPGWHLDHQGHRHRRRDERGGQRPQDQPGCRPRHHAGPRGRTGNQLRDDRRTWLRARTSGRSCRA